jgi:hypothetical protein
MATKQLRIPHSELLKSVARRIVEETDDRGRKTRTTAARDNRRREGRLATTGSQE